MRPHVPAHTHGGPERPTDSTEFSHNTTSQNTRSSGPNQLLCRMAYSTSTQVGVPCYLRFTNRHESSIKKLPPLDCRSRSTTVSDLYCNKQHTPSSKTTASCWRAGAFVPARVRCLLLSPISPENRLNVRGIRICGLTSMSTFSVVRM